MYLSFNILITIEICGQQPKKGSRVLVVPLLECLRKVHYLTIAQYEKSPLSA